MNKYKSILWSLCLLLVASVGLTACDDGDDLNTDQFGNDISLNTFGPCPVLRGGVLSFLGSNLDQITEVRLPGADPITAINVVSKGKVSEISIDVPKEKCEPGIVTLITAKGGEIKTLTPVTYIENITLTGFYVGSEGNLSGNVGDVITFKGDYLNLMHAVVFADGVYVEESEFTAHDRYTISCPIPKEAKSGRPMLSDMNPEGENLLYADNALNITLPTATALTPAKLKAGDVLTVTGTALSQIQSVKLEGAEVPNEGITVNGDKLMIYLPATATDGEVMLVTFSGVEIPAGKIETVVPTELSAAPAPVKAGDVLTVTGKDLDLVTSIAFNGADGAIKTQTATAITAEVPATAKDGDLTLSLANGKSVTVAYTLVKPAVEACNPAQLMAGNTVMIKGTDLDLVTAVTFPGEKPQTVDAKDFTAQSEKAIALTIPAAAAGQGLTLTLANGETVEYNELIVTPATDPAISEAPASMTQGKQATIKGKNFNNIEALYLGATKIVKIASRSDSEMTFTVPENAATGEQDIIAVGLDGNRYTMGKTKVVAPEIDLIAEGIMLTEQQAHATYPIGFDWGDGNKKFRIMKTGLLALNLRAGVSKFIIYKEAGATGQIQVNNANWGGVVTIADWAGDQTRMEQIITPELMECITSIADGWSDTAFILQGDLGHGVTGFCILP